MNLQLLALRASPALLLLVPLLTGCDSKQAVISVPPPKDSWFVDRSAALGVDFTFDAGESDQLMLPQIMGAGVALFDSDGDGDLDLYLTNGTNDFLEVPPPKTLTNRYYENVGEDGQTRFVDSTEKSGLGDGGYGMGVAVGDIDNDGDTDVYVTNFGSGHLYLNEGGGRYREITELSGTAVTGWPSSAAFLDYDRDGFLDLFVLRYVEFDPETECTHPTTGAPDVCGPMAFDPATDILFHNEGDRTFVDQSTASGITTVSAAGLGVVCEDLNADGWVDIYVANDAYANNLWINQGDGTFLDSAVVKGTAVSANGHVEAGMGVSVADFNGDETLDLFVTHLVGESNTLYLGRSDGRGFYDGTAVAGLATSGLRYTSFGTVAFDIELDGDLDLLVVSGRVNTVVRDRADSNKSLPEPVSLASWDELAEPNLFYLNDGKGRFTLRNDLIGTLASDAEVSRGLAVGDIDGDGDLDVVVSSIESPARVHLNEAPRQGRWLSVKAFDPRLSRDALGARVTAVVGERRLLRTVSPASSYLTSSDPRAHFGLGEVQQVDRIEILWPDGLHEAFTVDCVDCAVELRRGEGEVL